MAVQAGLPPVNFTREQFDQLLGRLGNNRPKPTIRLKTFSGTGDRNATRTWIEDVENYFIQAGVDQNAEKAKLAFSQLSGPAREEIKNQLGNNPDDYNAIKRIILQIFGPADNWITLQQSFYSKIQKEGEALSEFSRDLTLLYDRVIEAAPQDHQASLRNVRDAALIEQFTAGLRDRFQQQDVQRVALARRGQPFQEFREEILELYRRAEVTTPRARVREVETDHQLANLTQRVLELSSDVHDIRNTSGSGTFQPDENDWSVQQDFSRGNPPRGSYSRGGYRGAGFGRSRGYGNHYDSSRGSYSGSRGSYGNSYGNYRGTYSGSRGYNRGSQGGYSRGTQGGSRGFGNRNNGRDSQNGQYRGRPSYRGRDNNRTNDTQPRDTLGQQQEDTRLCFHCFSPNHIVGDCAAYIEAQRRLNEPSPLPGATQRGNQN